MSIARRYQSANGYVTNEARLRNQNEATTEIARLKARIAELESENARLKGRASPKRDRAAYMREYRAKHGNA